MSSCRHDEPLLDMSCAARPTRVPVRGTRRRAAACRPVARRRLARTDRRPARRRQVHVAPQPDARTRRRRPNDLVVDAPARTIRLAGRHAPGRPGVGRPDAGRGRRLRTTALVCTPTTQSTLPIRRSRTPGHVPSGCRIAPAHGPGLPAPDGSGAGRPPAGGRSDRDPAGRSVQLLPRAPRQCARGVLRALRSVRSASSRAGRAAWIAWFARLLSLIIPIVRLGPQLEPKLRFCADCGRSPTGMAGRPAARF